MREEAADEDALLRAAIDSYTQGYRRNPAHYYSGINALTLMHLHRHLTGDARYDHLMTSMAGAVRFAAENDSETGQAYWSKVTLGDLEVVVGTPEAVKIAYKEAIASNAKDRFALNSSRAQLLLLHDLGYRPDNVAAGIAAFDRALAKMAQPQDLRQPRQVFLFSGHMVDAPGRTPPRFPADKVALAEDKIAEVLDRLGAGPDDLALTQGACGGDLLFTRACQQRGVAVRWLQPFAEPEFIHASVLCGGESWREIYEEARAKQAAPPEGAPDFLGPPPRHASEAYPYERCNLWLLYTALAMGVDKVRFACLWDGGGGDGPGGTAHMYNEVKRRSGNVTWIDTRKLW